MHVANATEVDELLDDAVQAGRHGAQGSRRRQTRIRANGRAGVMCADRILCAIDTADLSAALEIAG